MTHTVRRCPNIAGAVFDTGYDHVRFVVDKVALGRVFLKIMRLLPLSIIPPVLHSNLLNTIIRRTSGRSLGTSNLVADIGVHWTGTDFHIVSIASAVFVVVSSNLQKQAKYLTIILREGD
jgi:hypothetical protein